MDYSRLNDDPEASPWNTSPQTSHHSYGGQSASGAPPAFPISPGNPEHNPFASSLENSQHESQPESATSDAFPSTPDPVTTSHSSFDPQDSMHAEFPEPNQTPVRQLEPTAEEHEDGTQGQQPDAQGKGVAGDQAVKGAAAKNQTGARPAKATPQYKLQAKITALERSGKKEIVLRFDATTNLPNFRSQQYRDIRRTHAEFVKFAEHLISNNPEALVPAVPPAVTSAGAGTDEDEGRVKRSLQRWLNIVCSNDFLMRDEEMIYFIESDFGYSPVMRMKQPATGVRRKVIKQFAPPPDDTPELQDARPVVKRFYLGTMDAGQKIDRLVKTRKALGLAEADFGVRMAQMQVQEIHTGLANAFRKLGRTVQAVGDYHAAQGTAEATTLGDALNYHSADSFIVKETLTNRHILLRDLLTAQSNTRSRLSAADRLKMSSNPRREKVDEAITALDDARSHEEYLGRKTQAVTANLVREKRRWFERTARDLRAALREYVIRQIEAERRALSTLESVRPDIRAIDASGGLSRLGRESHPAARRASLAASQGPRGDAWSGVQRRGDALTRSVAGGSGAVGSVPEEGEEDGEGGEGAGGDGQGGGAVGKGKQAGAGGGQGKGKVMEDDDDRVDARNAASRLAASTF